MWVNYLLWIIYIALLGVLLPHTAWVFNQFEPQGWEAVGWIAAFAFEAAIAAFTWRLKQVIEATPKYRAGAVWLRRLQYRYLNPYGLGLLAALTISALANWAHAVEFGQDFRVFTDYSIAPATLSVAFGAILPVISLLFARVLAATSDVEEGANEELGEAKQTIKELRRELRSSEVARTTAEERFGAIGDLIARLFAEEKRQRILAAKQQWPALSSASIAIIAESSPSYVSEVLREGEDLYLSEAADKKGLEVVE